MPQRKCCVPSCSASQIDGAVLHSFPNPSKHYERFKVWVSNAGLFNEDDDYIFRNRRICRIHFEEIYHYPKNRLNILAIPTLHLQGISAAMELEPVAEYKPQSYSTGSTSSAPYIESVFATCEHGDMVVDEPQACVTGSTGIVPCFGKASEAATVVKPVEVIQAGPLQPRNNKRNTSYANSLWFQSLGETEIELHKIVRKTQAQLKRCQKTKVGMAAKLKLARKLVHAQAYKTVTKDLTPAAKTFFAMQTREAAKAPKGRRFTLEEKILALSLHKPSPKAYRLLSQICVLPKKSTLNKLMTKISLSPGINYVIFEHLQNRVAKMPAMHKYCTILFDEMAISANLSYDKHNDFIKGFCYDGTQRSAMFADHVLVFMVRGILKKFKQPISYTFCAGTTNTINLKSQLVAIIRKVLATGLKVVSVTYDQGATNMAAINALINDTNASYQRQNKDFKGGYFEIDSNIIYPIFDPPHLIKDIRNNLITKDLLYLLDGKVRIAKWQHIEALYKKGPGYRGVRLVPKLTARHCIPKLIPKMKVKYCTQVFSKTVSVAMGFTAGTGRIPRDSRDTADLLMFFDELFDSVNHNSHKAEKGKIYRSAVTRKSPHWKLWTKSLPILKSMRFLCPNGKRRLVSSVSNWTKMIEAFQQVCKKLHSLGLNSVIKKF